MVLERIMGMTITGEIFQPVRLYYKVLNRKKVEKYFERLQCLEYDALKERWVWIYDEEAKSINFTNQFSSIREEASPVIIGSFVWKGDGILILDLRSFERALEAIQFFDNKIPRSIAKVTHCATVNKVFELKECALTGFDVFFENNDNMTEIDPQAVLNRIKEATLSINNMPNTQAITSFLDKEKDCFFEVEKFPIHFYENGIESLKASFILRRTIAMQRWGGNVNFSFKYALKMIFKTIWSSCRKK